MSKPSIFDMLRISRAAIGEMVDVKDHVATYDLAHKAGCIAQRAAWLAEYFEWRGAAGCGDYGHARAAEKADKKLKAVRKAMGYSYP